MAAQQDNNNPDDLMNADPGTTPVQAPADGSNQPISQPEVSVDNMSGDRGQLISGPPLDQPADTSVPEVSEPFVSPAPAPAPTDDVQDDDDKKKEEKEGKKGNPLQSLAKKLSELKSELVEDNADEKKGDGEEVAEIKPEMPVESGEDSPEVSAPEPELPAVENPPEVGLDSSKSETEPLTPAPAEPASVPAPDPLSPTDSAMEAATVVDPTPLAQPAMDPASANVVPDMSSTGSDVAQAPSSLDDIMPGSIVPDAQEQAAQPEVAPVSEEVAEELPGVSIEEAQAKEGPVSNMVDTGPEAVMGAGQTEPAADSSVLTSTLDDPTKPLDEAADNSVSTDDIRAKSAVKGGSALTITQVLDTAIERNASDVQISVGYPVMIRIDGTLIALDDTPVSQEAAEELILPVLSDQKKELLEVNREVDLAYTHENGTNARFRINAYYSRQNLTAAFRLIPSRIRTIEELQLPAMYNQFAAMKQGLVLITGPTGHGKSTTLAAILQAINMTRAVHMVTIEDPIEYIFPKGKAVVDQREMHDDTHSWTIALKSALRQDPDVMLVGEMRDYETIAATVTLAETGHLVFATLHTNSASQTVDRIIDVFPENQQAQIRTQLANILEAVVAQRLIPLEGGGRRAVSEILLGTPAIRNLVREGKTHQIDNVIRTSADVGMVSLEHSLVKLVRDGLITMDKAQEYAVHPEEVVRLLKT